MTLSLKDRLKQLHADYLKLEFNQEDVPGRVFKTLLRTYVNDHFADALDIQGDYDLSIYDSTDEATIIYNGWVLIPGIMAAIKIGKAPPPNNLAEAINALERLTSLNTSKIEELQAAYDRSLLNGNREIREEMDAIVEAESDEIIPEPDSDVDSEVDDPDQPLGLEESILAASHLLSENGTGEKLSQYKENGQAFTMILNFLQNLKTEISKGGADLPPLPGQ